MEKEKLFNYKGNDIIVRKKGHKYQVGIKGHNGIDIWFEPCQYDTVQLATTSGMEYARIIIDKMLLAKKRGA
jgi:hypothetical protein